MWLVYLGFFLWLMFVLFEFEFCVPVSNNRGMADLWYSLGIHFNRLDSIDYGASLGKLTGLIWMVLGMVTEYILNMELGGIASALAFLLPVWFGAAAWKSY